MAVGVVKLFGLCCVFDFCFCFEGLLLIKVALKKIKIQENFNNRNDGGLTV